MPLSTIAKLFGKGSGPAAPALVEITANSLGAVSTAPGFLSGSFRFPTNAPVGTLFTFPLGGDPTFQQLFLSVNNAGIAASGSFVFEVSSDPSGASWNSAQYVLLQANTSVPGLTAILPAATPVVIASGRSTAWCVGIAGALYVRMRVTTVCSGIVTFNWVATTNASSPPVINPSITGNGIPSDGLAVPDGPAGSIANAVIPVASYVSTGATSNLFTVRTPAIYRGAQFSGAGQNIIWKPQTGKKFRLMKYKIEVSEDATLSGGPLPINLSFSTQQAASLGSQSILNFFQPGYSHRLVVPATVLATSGALYDSGFIDLGNGLLPNAADSALIMGIQIPQTTAAVNPVWALPSSQQWEAVSVGFKTSANAGQFRFVQSNGNDGTTSVATALAAPAKGNAIIVIGRTTNVVGGVPTIAVTDTAGNTYTVTALTTNATDGANGSSLFIAYAINIIGGAPITVTITPSVNLPTATQILALEYAGLGSGGIDAALVGATGNSAAPASGNYTPATTGDLIICASATAGSAATTTTIGNNFRVILGRGSVSGLLTMADNFGNGALTTGVVNVIAIGTEE